MTPIVGVFLVALIEIALGVVVWLRNPGRSVNRWFAAFATTLAVWGTLVGVRRSLEDPVVVLAVVRVLWADGGADPGHVRPLRRRLPAPGGAAAPPDPGGDLPRPVHVGPVLLALDRGRRPARAGGLPPAGLRPAFPVLGAYMAVCSTWALAHLAGKLRRATGFARAQLHYVLLGAALTALGALTLGIVVPLVTGSSRLGVYGPYFTLLWLGFTAHSIVRHRLMDVRVVISRSAAYAAGFCLTAALLVGGGVLLDTLMPDRDLTLTPLGAVLLGLAASALFLLLAPRMRRLADRYLYRPAYDARALVREGSRAMGTFADPARVTAAMARPDRARPPPREPHDPRADPRPGRLRAPGEPARRSRRRPADGADGRVQPAHPGAVGRDGRARPGPPRRAARRGRGERRPARACARGARRWRCPCATGG